MQTKPEWLFDKKNKAKQQVHISHSVRTDTKNPGQTRTIVNAERDTIEMFSQGFWTDLRWLY